MVSANNTNSMVSQSYHTTEGKANKEDMRSNYRKNESEAQKNVFGCELHL